MKWIASLLPLLVCSGCMIVSHDFTSADGSKDHGSVTALFSTSKAAKIATRTRYGGTNGYNHGTSAAGVENTGDARTIEAITELIKTIKPPVAP